MPTAEGLPFFHQSVSIQLTAAPEAARFVLTRAWIATASAASALPALNPNQPNQRSAAPRMTNGILLGLTSWLGSTPFLLPMMRAAATAETAAERWTTSP